MIAAYVTPGVHIDGMMSAIIFVVILAVLNATIGAVLRFISFPINFLLFGLVSTLIGFFMILLTDHFVDGFHIDNWFAGVIFAIIWGVVDAMLKLSDKKE